MDRKPDRRGLGRSGWMAAVVLGTALGSMAPTMAAHADPADVDDISRYCTACWRNARLPQDRWMDCTQEVLTRLLERIEPDRWESILGDEGPERQEFMRAIDAVKKRTQRSRKYAAIAADPAGRNPSDSPHGDDWEQIDNAAKRLLSERQQRILQLSRDGWSVPEMAVELATTPERISDEKYKAIRKLHRELTGQVDHTIHQ